jgi:TolA-binding protein
MDTLDDLLIRRRRAGLSEAEERRLRSGLRASPEHELSLLAGDVFERDGAPLPGDEERLRRIVAGALPRTGGTTRSWPRVRLWVAAPVFLAAAAAASVGGYRALSARPLPAPSELSPRPTLASRDAREDAESRARASLAPTPPASEPAPVLDPPPPAPGPAKAAVEPRTSHDAGRTAAPAPPSFDRPSHTSRRTSSRERPRAPRRHEPPTAPVPSPAGLATPASAFTPSDDGAAALFQRANVARRTDWSAAAALYAELVERHPGSAEAGVAEVALGKWSLALGRGGDALEWFRAHQRRGAGPLAAEALWGEARALESIGSHAAARRPWQRLLESYPDSPYARVARERLAP